MTGVATGGEVRVGDEDPGLVLPGFDRVLGQPASHSGGRHRRGDPIGDDLGGQVWVTWEGDALYLSAVITDDVHAQPNTRELIWSGDSIQLALAAGTPGETSRWYEYGFALTPNGPEAYLWSAAQGSAGAVEGANVAIVRDEASLVTTYEVALPWELIAPMESGDGMFSMSLVLNENDGAGRTGWIELGSGIAGAKDPSLFEPMRLE